MLDQKSGSVWLVMSICSMLIVAVIAADHVQAQNLRYEVTVTNLMRGQVLSPPVVATHGASFTPIFSAGEAASDALRDVAEDAVNDALMDQLFADPNVVEVGVMDGPIAPGESASITLDAGAGFARVSLVSMLIQTNDGFIALNSVQGPLFFPYFTSVFGPTRTYDVPVYDAGTEVNSEDCDFIPGPPCGNAGVRDSDGAEGFVHIHAGVHGVADLDQTIYDWHNPAARITIRQMTE